MGFAPCERWTAHRVLSVCRNLAKADAVDKVLTEQVKIFYQTALNEIVTLLNGAIDRSYLTNVISYYVDLGDSFTINNEYLIAQSDPLHPIDTNLMAINVLQKKVVTINGTNTLIDPLENKKIDRLNYIEQEIEGAGSAIEGLETHTGQILPIKDIGIAQSLMRADFPHESYKNDLIYIEIGGEPTTNISNQNWTAAQSEYLPTTGNSTDKIFNSYYIRIRKDPRSRKFNMRPAYVDGTNYRRIKTIIWYQRMPNYPKDGTTPATDGWASDSTHPSKYVDLPEKHISLLIKRIYTYLLLQQTGSIPDQLAADTTRDFANIYANMNAEQRAAMSDFINKIKMDLGR